MRTGNKHIAVKVTAVIIAVLVIINVIILMNPNRRARLIEFFGESSHPCAYILRWFDKH